VAETIAVDESLPWPEWVPLLKPSDILRRSQGLGGDERPHDLMEWTRLVVIGPLDDGGRRHKRRGVSEFGQGGPMFRTIVKSLAVELGIEPVRVVEYGPWEHYPGKIMKKNDDEKVSTRTLAAAWNRAMKKHLGYIEVTEY
jgi:hypothetical protein